MSATFILSDFLDFIVIRAIGDQPEFEPLNKKIYVLDVYPG